VWLAGWLSLCSPPLDAQTIDRWLFIPYGHPGRLDHEPNERSPNGRTELHFSYDGRPWRLIRRFSQSLARDSSLASSTPDAFDDGRPDPAEINRLLEVFQKAAIEAELTPASLVAPFPASSGLPPPTASDAALLASATAAPTATAAAIASFPPAPPPAEASPRPASPPNEGTAPIR
jgi:hypothetical protein